MVPEDGRIVAPPHVPADAWLDALPAGCGPLVLAPGSTRGWFGGRAIVAWSPQSVAERLPIPDAATVLDDAFSTDAPCLVAALLPYEGLATTARYTGGLVLTAQGWRVWGALGTADVPVLETGPAFHAASLAPHLPLAEDVRTDLDDAAFRAGVREIVSAITDGDVYVVNLTRRLTGTPAAAPVVAFRTLVSRSHAEMAAYWEVGDATLASASPERFVRVTGTRVEVCPIKGTRPRGQGAADRAMAAELAESEKERAEHVMIVDLERNDLGRVCTPGSVVVDPLFEVVATPYCHQMVSRVAGDLLPDASLPDLLASAFPCGSVTGAPKIAAMNAIASLEPSARGAYTGSLVIATPGELDSSVLIRTAEYAHGIVRWGTGGGITVDSDPADEWLETVLKASPFLGDGVCAVALRETCRVVHGRVPLLARHLARLAAGGCGATALGRVRAAVEAALAQYGAEAAYGRLSVTVAPDGAVTAAVTDARSTLHVPGGPALLPVTCAPPRLPAGAAKPADRSLWDAAQHHALVAGAHQAVLVDARGNVIDGATASVWVRVGDRLLTPPAPGAVAGVARGVVFDAAARLGYIAEESVLPAAVLDAADEVFFSNALAGVVAAREREGRASVALAEEFRRLFGE